MQKRRARVRLSSVAYAGGVIRDPKGLEAWEREQQARRPVDYEANLRWFNAAVEEAKALGVWRRQDPWEGFWEKMEWIKLLHRTGRGKGNGSGGAR